MVASTTEAIRVFKQNALKLTRVLKKTKRSKRKWIGFVVLGVIPAQSLAAYTKVVHQCVQLYKVNQAKWHA